MYEDDIVGVGVLPDIESGRAFLGDPFQHELCGRLPDRFLKRISETDRRIKLSRKYAGGFITDGR